MSTITVNLRSLGYHTTGVQRYVQQVFERLRDGVNSVKPKGSGYQGIKGHMWEQLVMPSLIKGTILWSPANTGPLSVSAQVVTIHDAATLDHPEWFEPIFARWYTWLLPKLAAKARKIITVSEFSRSRLIETLNVPMDKVECIANGVSPFFSAPHPEQARMVGERLGLDRPFFLYVGSLEPRKNLRTLLQAWKIFNNDQFLLAVVGSMGRIFNGSGFDELPSGVRLVGRVDEQYLPALYSTATAFIFPSTYEGFGLPPLEAMACGCTCLVSNTTSLPEVCGPAWTHGNRNGISLYFDPQNPEEIAAMITQAASFDREERSTLSRAAVAHAKQFTWDECAQKTLHVLNRTQEL